MVPDRSVFIERFRLPPPGERALGRVRVLAERDPTAFQRAFAEAVAQGERVFLADPSWGAGEHAQLQALAAAEPAGPTDLGWLGIPTGGTSGAIKVARHDEVTISSAVQGFVQHFSVGTVNAVGLLPLHHVSGFMAWMRCALTGGQYQPWDWKRIERGDRPAMRGDNWFLSLVPTQLERLLGQAAAVDWLRQFRAVFIGGGPSWPGLVERGAAVGLPLAFSYGMTETAAMVTALRPEEFRAGQRGSGQPLPHVQVRIAGDGGVWVNGASLFRGYWPAWREPGEWATSDRGEWGADRSLRLLGRRDAVIISGGEKIDPAEVEAALRASGVFADVAVVGVPDPEWGQTVVACHPPLAGAFERQRVEQALRVLARYKWPKRYVAVDPWPRTAQGKLSSAALLAAITPAS